MTKINERLAQALLNVGTHKGLDLTEEYGICVNGEYCDNYLLVLYLALLLENGQLEVKVAPSKMDYMLKLLHIEDNA